MDLKRECVALCLLGLVGCSGGLSTEVEPVRATADIAQTQQWGGAKQVVGFRHLYISDQPDARTLDQAAAAGVTAVISLRGPDEHQWDERSAVTARGLTYYQVPVVTQGQSLSSNAVNKVSEIVGQHAGEKLLVHCSSGNRASAWLAVHLVVNHHWSTAEALDVARSTGLDNSNLEARIKRYLSDVDHSTNQ